MGSKLFLVVTRPHNMLVKPVVDAVFFSRKEAVKFIYTEGSEYYQSVALIAEVNAGFGFVGSFSEGLSEDFYA